MDNISDVEFIPQAQYGDADKFELRYKINGGEVKSKMITKKEFEFIQYHLKSIIQ